MTFSEIAGLLKSSGLRATPQRIAVYEYLDTHRTHPTADEIFASLVAQYPSFSRTTIYNSIRALEDAALIQTVMIDGDFSRYDANTAPHVHFKCIRCCRVTDVFDCAWPPLPPSLAPYDTQRVMVHFYGVCPSCQSQTTLPSAKCP